ncbi:MAG: NUDIX hydrolase [Candidatus Paceibacterota bacterium]
MSMRKIKRDIVSALIFSKDGKLFQGMKDFKKGGVYSDCWHIPGGGIDEGENQKEALIREIKEETGIDISPCKIELIDSSGRGESQKALKTGEEVLCEMQFYVYKVVLDDKNADEIKVELNDDLVNFQWTEIDNLKKIKMTPPSVVLFKKLGYI